MKLVLQCTVLVAAFTAGEVTAQVEVAVSDSVRKYKFPGQDCSFKERLRRGTHLLWQTR